MKTAISSLLAAVTLFAAAQARAQEVPAASGVFGEQGQLFFDANLGGSFVYEKVSFMDNSNSTTTIRLVPSLMFFLAPNIAVGGAVSFTRISDDNDSLTALGIGPAAGFNLPLSPLASLLPQLSLGYVHVSDGTNSGYQIAFSVLAPVLLHIAPHLFIGVGPSFTYSFISKVEGNDAPKTTNFTLGAVIGGWL